MSEVPKQWMPRERWDALVRGDSCPLCSAFVNAGSEDEYGFTIADLQISRLRLARNQDVKGYCVLICHRHVREPYELSTREQAMFFEDMCRAGLALERAFDAVKMNFHILGNAVPHLHAHIQPRYYGDPAPNRIIWGDDAHPLVLSPEDYATRIALIKQHLTPDTHHDLSSLTNPLRHDEVQPLRAQRRQATGHRARPVAQLRRRRCI